MRTAVVRPKWPCLLGKLQKLVFSKVINRVVGGVALCDIRRVSEGMYMQGRREAKMAVSMGEATKTCLSQRVRRCADVVLSGGCGTL